MTEAIVTTPTSLIPLSSPNKVIDTVIQYVNTHVGLFILLLSLFAIASIMAIRMHNKELNVTNKLIHMLQENVMKMRKWLKQPMHIQFVVICAVTIVFYCIAYITNPAFDNWISNVCISLACGFVSGLVLYCLSNFRNTLQSSTQNEYNDLKEIRLKVFEMNGLAFHILQQLLEEIPAEDMVNQIDEIYNSFVSICEQTLDLDDSVFAELGISEKDMNDDNCCIMYYFEEKRHNELITTDNLSAFDCIQFVERISKKTKRLEEKIKMPIHNRLAILRELKKSVL